MLEVPFVLTEVEHEASEKLSLYIRAIEKGLSTPVFLKVNKKVTNSTVDLKSSLKKSLGKIPLYLLALENRHFIALETTL